MKAKPEGLIEEHLEYLDNLRESGVVNMFGAAQYLASEFTLTKSEAEAYLLYWIWSGRQV